MTNLVGWSAVETAAAIARREVSVAEVTQAHLARVAEVDPGLNAVVEPMTEAALADAEAKDAARPDELPDLWGVPITIKINVDLAGYPNSNGVPALNKVPAAEDSPVVANLKAAGAVVIGRSSAPEFSLRWFTSNPIYGVTLNPWDKALTPGGSSGGAAAAVATGMGCLGHGNDLGGSLRYPAFACGLATLRPSLGRVPAFNPSAAVERAASLQAMSVQGVIARNVGDVQAALPALSRGDWRDPQWRAAPVGAADPRRVGVCVDPFGDGVDAAVAAAVMAGAEAAREAGFEVVEVMPPRAGEAAVTWGELLNAETEVTLLDTIHKLGSDEINSVVEAFADAFGKPDRAAFIAAQARRITLQRDWAGMFQGIDALILPVSAAVPFRNDQDFLEPDTLPQIIAAQRVLCIVNLLGLPAATVRTTDARPVPLGVQVVGPVMGDEACLHVAAGIERALGFDLRPMDPKP